MKKLNSINLNGFGGLLFCVRFFFSNSMSVSMPVFLLVRHKLLCGEAVQSWPPKAYILSGKTRLSGI